MQAAFESLPARECAFTAIDFETTGTVSGWPVEPWQIGMAKMTPQGALLEKFSSLLGVSADRPFNRFAPGRHAQLRDELALSPTLPQMWNLVEPWVVGTLLVAHNIGTERTMLTKAAPLHRPGPWIDTLKLARRVYPGLDSYALEDLVVLLGLLPKVREACPGLAAHDAFFDAVACGVLYTHFLSLPGWESVTVGALI